MQLLYYSSRADANSKRLGTAVCQVIPQSKSELFNSLAGFQERLRMPIEPDSIAVLSASNRDELQKMQMLRGMLTETYVVLVIPDRTDETIKLAHLLLPRFLCTQKSDFKDLKIVLRKMFINSQYSRNRALLQELRESVYPL